MKTDNKGIDYSLGQSNINQETNIRYGVIPHHEVGQFWYEESEAYYIDCCADCGQELTPEDIKQSDIQEEIYVCPSCGNSGEMQEIWDNQDPVSFYYDDGKLQAEQQADDTDIFILQSPYFTYSQFCSPCAPGAGYLLNELSEKDENNKTYCFGHDWFESGKAPYTVYSVETGEVVNPVNP